VIHTSRSPEIFAEGPIGLLMTMSNGKAKHDVEKDSNVQY